MAAKKKALWTAAKVQEQSVSLAEAIQREFKLPVEGPFDMGVDSILHEQEAQVRTNGGVKRDGALETQYAAHIKQGVALPPCILNDLHQMIDGNTRKGAAGVVGQDVVPVIVVTTKGNHTLDRMIGGWANQRGGKRLADRESAQLARDLAENGMQAAQIARHLGYSPNKVANIVRAVEVEQRAERLGLPLDGVDEASKLKLHKLPLDVGFTEALNLARDARLKPAQLGKVVDELVQVGTEDESRTIAKSARTEHAERIQQVSTGLLDPKPSPWAMVKMHIGALVKVDVSLLTPITDEDQRTATASRLDEAIAVLQAARQLLD